MNAKRAVRWMFERAIASMTLWAVAIWTLSAQAAATSTPSETASQLNLRGIVNDPDGNPISQAMVRIHSAVPRKGPSKICPSCYADCVKQAQTDELGLFKIESLDSNLLFSVLVAAPGFTPEFIERVRPEKGPITATLKPIAQAQLEPKKFLKCRVVDAANQPVASAMIEFLMYYGEEANCGGQCEGVDWLAVSDAQGQFVLTSVKKFDRMSVTASAPGFAPKRFLEVTNDVEQVLKLGVGATVTGRIVRQGKTVPNIAVHLCSFDGQIDTYLGDFRTVTDDEGRFYFQNMPAYHVMKFYCAAKALSDQGSIIPRKVRVGGDGTTKDLGDCLVHEGFRVSGRLVSTNREPLAAGIEVSLTADGTIYSSNTTETDEQGAFVFQQVPPGSFVKLTCALPGYRFSLENRSYNVYGRDDLEGRVDGDISGIEAMLEPGKANNDPEFEERREKLRLGRIQSKYDPAQVPLSGVEPIASAPSPVK